MKRAVVVLIFTCLACVAYGQTSKELIGKWRMISETKEGMTKEPKEPTFQVFFADGVFEGIVGEKSRKGKWTLSENNQLLTVKISVINVKFKVEYFDAKKRIISHETMGTLTYEKVED